MRLNRLGMGLASFTLATVLTGYAVNEVKNNEIEAMLRKNEQLTIQLKQEQERSHLFLEQRLKVQEQYDTLFDEKAILQDGFDRVQKENMELKKKQQEARVASVSRGSGGKTMTIEATAYTAECKGCSGITATGIDVRNTTTYNGYGIIATDPRVIPLGSIVIMNNRKYIAADKGGAIKGNKVDVLVASYAEAVQFGRKSIQVTVIPKS
jgi:3D (Asp-Asp-Asp) domain-containing protein